MKGQYFTYLNTNQIIEKEKSEFKPLESKDFANLVSSIKEVGILQPLIVYPSGNGDDRYVIHAGYNRLRAARELNLKEVPCIVVEDRTSAVHARFDTDLYRRHLKAEEIKEYEKIKKHKLEDHFKRIFIPEIIEIFKEGYINIEHLKVLSSFSQEEQKKFLETSKSISLKEEIRKYEEQIQSLTKKVKELEANQVPLEKLQKEIQQKLKEKEEEIERKIKETYNGESKEKLMAMIEEERARIEEEYRAEIEELSKNLRDMSKAKEQAQRQIDALQEEIKKLRDKEKEHELIQQKIEYDLKVTRKTLETVVNADMIKERIDFVVKDLVRIYQTMILYGRDEFSQKDVEKLSEVFEQLKEITEEITTFFKK